MILLNLVFNQSQYRVRVRAIASPIVSSCLLSATRPLAHVETHRCPGSRQNNMRVQNALVRQNTNQTRPASSLRHLGRKFHIVKRIKDSVSVTDPGIYWPSLGLIFRTLFSADLLLAAMNKCLAGEWTECGTIGKSCCYNRWRLDCDYRNDRCLAVSIGGSTSSQSSDWEWELVFLSQRRRIYSLGGSESREGALG
jgi:hypothetical protein